MTQRIALVTGAGRGLVVQIGMGTPVDVAATVAFPASDKADFIGERIAVNGGHYFG
ncbi:MAG: hypothetical protein AVDCRST_MAG86-459 [uncultured Truepera sp.]|uniref:Uncharacterized protein n=1 Tax=uncultured Truepera sp. TaxID=543023 RepID=A0A6J4UWZ0_9DEIN|nr:MAG: hypothetical protein AVDCRST_MAG86-459 [uncultured Truepera sp.]